MLLMVEPFVFHIGVQFFMISETLRADGSLSVLAIGTDSPTSSLGMGKSLEKEWASYFFKHDVPELCGGLVLPILQAAVFDAMNDLLGEFGGRIPCGSVGRWQLLRAQQTDDADSPTLFLWNADVSN